MATSGARDDIQGELAQVATALATVAAEFARAPVVAQGETPSPLNALYFAIHHLHHAVEMLAAEVMAGRAHDDHRGA